MKNEFISDKHGNPVTFYHGTDKDFEHFHYLSHFGTMAAANQIKVQRSVRSGKIIPVHLDIKNPFEIPDFGKYEDIDYHHVLINYAIWKILPKDIIAVHPVLKFHNVYGALGNYDELGKLMAHPYLKQVLSYVYSCDDKMAAAEVGLDNLFLAPGDARQLSLQRFIRYFEGQGYDGFSYVNMVEDPGHTSYIPFRQFQIKRLDIDTSACPGATNSSELDAVEAANHDRIGKGYHIPYTWTPDQQTYQRMLLDGIYDRYKNQLGR